MAEYPITTVVLVVGFVFLLTCYLISSKTEDDNG